MAYGEDPSVDFNINTPDGSILGEFDDSATQYEYPWNEEANRTIRENHQYHNDMIKYIERIAVDGPDTTHPIPKTPKHKLSTILTVKQKLSTTLTGNELHVYLQKHLMVVSDGIYPKVEELGRDIVNLEDMIVHLQNGYIIIKMQNTKILQASIEYGKWLNVAFVLHQQAKLTHVISENWTVWLEKYVGISKSYSSKLREIATLLCDYPKFKYLGISFAEVYQRRKEIKAMIVLNPDISAFWKSSMDELNTLLQSTSI